MSKTWWKTQPVYPAENQQPYTTIGEQIPLPILSPEFTIYKYNTTYITDVLDFINANYIEGYQYSLDYFYAKMAIAGSTALVLMNNTNKIVGFIYCQPFQFRGNTLGYVDLMTVDKSNRGHGLAKILISHIVYYGGFQHYLHKKDGEPLPFPYFFKDKYYSIPLAVLKYRYGLTTRKNVQIDTANSAIKTIQLSNGSTASIVIHRFTYGILRNVKLGEVYKTTLSNYNKENYLELAQALIRLGVDFLVVLQSQTFFRTPIKLDNYLAGRDVHLHSYNLYIPPMEEDSDFQIDIF